MILPAHILPPKLNTYCELSLRRIDKEGDHFIYQAFRGRREEVDVRELAGGHRYTYRRSANERCVIQVHVRAKNADEAKIEIRKILPNATFSR